jgi:phage terminase large subunit-like protein
LSQLTPEDRETLSDLWNEHQRSENQNFIDTFFPDEGPLRRSLYQKHLEFFRAGQTERERAFIAANRIGKSTTAGGYETALHLTGIYPDWWEGRRFDHPVRWWAAGDTGETVREIIQPILFGPMSAVGTGIVRGRTIERITSKRGSPEAIETAYIRHSSGGLSSLLFKSYEQGRKSFQGTKMHGIWLDEEPSMQIYSECLLRCAATTPTGEDWGSLMCTFTPLLGISEVVMRYLGENMGQEVRTHADQLARYEQEQALQAAHKAHQEKRDLMGTPTPPQHKSSENPLERR